MSENGYRQYEDRVVAFLDILGWKNLIEQTKGDFRIVETLLDMTAETPVIAQQINRLKEDREEVPSGTEIAHFSDTIVLSCRNEPMGIKMILHHAVYLGSEFLRPALRLIPGSLRKSGLLCRGAIVMGKMFHNANVLFGPALIEAYLMESTLAVYPRILVAREVMEALGDDVQDLKAKVRLDSDGLLYLDIFSSALEAGSGDFTLRNLSGFRESIESALTQHEHDLRKRTKWAWMASLFNKVLQEHPDLSIQPLTTTIS